MSPNKKMITFHKKTKFIAWARNNYYMYPHINYENIVFVRSALQQATEDDTI